MAEPKEDYGYSEDYGYDMPSQKQDTETFDKVIQNLEDNIFDIAPEPEPEGEPPKKGKKGEEERRSTLPTLLDQDTADDVFKDFMKKEKNQRKYNLMGSELLFKPYWFFTYTANLVMKDENGNIIDSEEIGGRLGIDATNGGLADYLQDLLDNEPIEVVDLADEMGQVGGEARVLEPKMKNEKHLEAFIKQKIAGVLRTEKDNVSVMGFEMLWAPVYRYWMTIKKRTHNLQIDGAGGYPINFDDIPLRKKTWADIIEDDIELLKNPKKWREFLKNKGKAIRTSGAKAKGGQPKKHNNTLIEMVGGLIGVLLFLYGISQKPIDFPTVVIGVLIVGVLFWMMNHKRKKPLVPLPPPPMAMQPGYPPQGPQ
jgi:hypothetical protein